MSMIELGFRAMPSTGCILGGIPSARVHSSEFHDGRCTLWQRPLQHASIRLAGPQRSVLISTSIPSSLFLCITQIADRSLVLNESQSTLLPCCKKM